MSRAEGSEDKQYEPTQKKLEDARRKGEVPRSSDLNTAAAYAGFAIVAISMGTVLFSRLVSELFRLLENADSLSFDVFQNEGQAIFGGIIGSVIWHLLPWFIVPASLVILAIIAQRSFVIAPTKLQPKLSRISVLANAKNKFGRAGFFEFIKSFVKLLVFSGVLGAFLFIRTPDIVTAVNFAPAFVTTVMFQFAEQFIVFIFVVSLVVGLVDFLWQRAEHIRKNKMSRQEMVDEAKQMEGDPFVKQQRRQKAQEIALNKMLSDVPSADVIVVNPIHYAVALKWSKEPGSAPVCMAKGVDEIAARIREIAQNSAIPIHRNPSTARSLFAAVDVGSQILPEHYAAVAAAIRFAETVRGKAKDRNWNV